MKGRLSDKIRLQHIVDAIIEVEIYLEHVSYEQFLENSEKRFATIKQIEIIGEACNNGRIKGRISVSSLETDNWF